MAWLIRSYFVWVTLSQNQFTRFHPRPVELGQSGCERDDGADLGLALVGVV